MRSWNGTLDDVQEALKTDNHKDPVGAIGAWTQQYTDPLAWIGGDKYVDLTSRKLPERVNRVGSVINKPASKIDKAINPLRKIKVVDRAMNWVERKPGTTVGALAAAIFGGGALLGGGAAGAGGGAAGGAGTAGGGASAASSGIGGASAGSSSMPWAKLAQSGLGLLFQQGPQQEEFRPVGVDDTQINFATSSRKKKTPGATLSIDEALAKGDIVSANGIVMAAIQEMTKRIERLEKEA